MLSAKVDIYFACSFRDDDKAVNDYFLAICRALDLNPTNLSTAYAGTPPNVAKEKINRSQALVAVCTCRDELKTGRFQMPQAVHDEISFAFGSDIPVLMLVEDQVELAGFKGNFGTYKTFDRTMLYTPDLLECFVEAVHKLKMDVMGPHQIGAESGIMDARAEYVHHLVELRPDGGDFVWSYATSKRLVFTQPSKRSFPSHVWAVVPVNPAGSPPPMHYEMILNSSSRNIQLIDVIEEHTSSCVRSVMRPSIPVEEGDHIDYSTIYRSPHLNHVWMEDVSANSVAHLDDGDYHCVDGLVFLHRTKQAVIEFRFPREYGISRSQVRPFAGSYTSSIDYEVPSEIERAKVSIEQIAGNLTVKLVLDSPLPGHMYGVAWNPLHRPAPAAG